jgi:hypothetical protein
LAIIAAKTIESGNYKFKYLNKNCYHLEVLKAFPNLKRSRGNYRIGEETKAIK